MKKFFGIILTTLLMGGMLQSCQSEEGFFEEGEGLLKMRMVINNSLTRAEDSANEDLAEKCVIYVSSEKGLIHKFKGVDNVPSDLYLKSGSYVAEAWTGDSVTASFDKKFYKAYEPFTITKGDVKQVILNCKIANVVASINPDPILSEALADYTVTIGNTRGSLEFNAENAATAHGYFMQPNGDTSLSWTITGKRENGENYVKKGIIYDVKSAHEYVLNIKYTPDTNDYGGAFITVTVDDSELVINDIVEIKGAPVISGVGYDISKPLEGAPGKFNRYSVYVQGLGEFKSLKMRSADYTVLGFPAEEYDFITMSDDTKTELAAIGLTYESAYDSSFDTTSARISFSSELLNTLDLGTYVINFEAIDSNDKITKKDLTLKVSDAGVVLEETPWQEIYARHAKIYGRVVKDGMTNPGFRYRAVGSNDWTTVLVGDVELNASFTANLTDLQPGTKYEYQAIADDYINTESMYFTTESMFMIPNASFEYWCKGGFKNAVMPNENANNIFWDSGNQGAALASTVLLDKSSDMVHSGNYSARMASKWCGMMGMGAFSGGNMFSGVCTNVVISANATAELTYGQPFNGSRPAKLRGWANYRPGSVDYAGDALSKGATDHGQVMVALTTGTMYINPTAGNFFNSNDPSVLAFGEVTWTGNFSADGQLQEFVIPINYKEAANNTKATHIILQATASKFADRFVGSTSSVLYIDDLELVYE